jgi:hypothetical protein
MQLVPRSRELESRHPISTYLDALVLSQSSKGQLSDLKIAVKTATFRYGGGYDKRDIQSELSVPHATA